MKPVHILLTACALGFLSVALGAFGAHALRDLLSQNQRTDTFDLATRYQFFHSMAMLATGMMCERFPQVRPAAYFFLTGIVLFSGSLYILSITNNTSVAMVTPIGGVALLGGWAMLARGIWKKEN